MTKDALAGEDSRALASSDDFRPPRRNGNALVPSQGRALAPKSNLLALPPASKKELQEFSAVVLASFKIPSDGVLADPRAFQKAQTAALARKGYPREVLFEAYEKALEIDEWHPSTARMVALCDQIMVRERERLRQQREEEKYHIRVESERRAKAERIECGRRQFSEKFRRRDAQAFDSACRRIDSLGPQHLREFLSAVDQGKAWVVQAVRHFGRLEEERIAPGDIAAQNLATLRAHDAWLAISLGGSPNEEPACDLPERWRRALDAPLEPDDEP